MAFFINNNENVLVTYNSNNSKSHISFVDKGITYNFNYEDNKKEFIFIGKRLKVPSLEFLKAVNSINENKNRKISTYFVTNEKLDVIREYFKMKTENKCILKCVFHNDNRPSMSVDLEKGLFHCFSCKMGGSINRLHKKIVSK